MKVRQPQFLPSTLELLEDRLVPAFLSNAMTDLRLEGDDTAETLIFRAQEGMLVFGPSEQELQSAGVIVNQIKSILVIGNGGGDFIDGSNLFANLGLSANVTVTLLGNDGNDTILGTEQDDSIDGGAGNDLILALRGLDRIFGGEGNDSIDAGDGDNSVDGGAGNDLAFAGIGNDVVFGGTGDDSIDPGDGNDSVDGGAGNDLIFAANGNDLVFGSLGNDRMDGNSGDDLLDGGDGNDLIFGSEGDDNLFGSNGDDSLGGGAGSDQGSGGRGANFVFELDLSVQLASDSDPDGNGFVTRGNIGIIGQTFANSMVFLDLNSDGVIDQAAQTDGLGFYRFSVQVNRGTTNTTVATIGPQGPIFAITSYHFGDVVLEWNETLLNAIRAERNSPPVASRIMAMVHAAVYDAVNSIDRSHEAYLVLANSNPQDSQEAAATVAAHDVLATLLPNQATKFDVVMNATLGELPDGASKAAGIAIGASVAQQILAARANDGSATITTYLPGTGPGDWQTTPPTFAAALLPNWAKVTPFAMSSADQYLPAAPPELDSAEYAASVNLVKEFGAANSATRTAEQTEIALFWADGGGTETPPGHWNTIAQNVSMQQGLTLAQNARLFALLGIAEADAAISCWNAKYEYELWRPITAIRNADLDGNPATTADPTWLPLIVTPNFPTYTSGHSTFSGAAATVLASYFGADNVSFSTKSDGLLGISRTYSSFSSAANEAALSRLYGGIHFDFDNIAGLTAGQAIGNLVATTQLN